MTNLQTELALPAYSGLSDADAAARLNTPIVTARRLVAMGDIKPLLYQDAIPPAMLRLEDAANAALPVTSDPGYTAAAQLKTAARMVLAWLTDPHVEHVDLDNATAKAGLAAIVAGGIIGPAMAAAIDALANVTTTRARQIKVRYPVTAADVHAARAQP